MLRGIVISITCLLITSVFAEIESGHIDEEAKKWQATGLKTSLISSFNCFNQNLQGFAPSDRTNSSRVISMMRTITDVPIHSVVNITIKYATFGTIADQDTFSVSIPFASSKPYQLNQGVRVNKPCGISNGSIDNINNIGQASFLMHSNDRNRGTIQLLVLALLKNQDANFGILNYTVEFPRAPNCKYMVLNNETDQLECKSCADGFYLPPEATKCWKCPLNCGLCQNETGRCINKATKPKSVISSLIRSKSQANGGRKL